MELAHKTLSEAGQSAAAGAIQQQIDSLKEQTKTPVKDPAPSALSKVQSLRWKRTKLLKQIARARDDEQNLRKKAADALAEAEVTKNRGEQLESDLAKIDAEMASAFVAAQSETGQPTPAQQFLGIESRLRKMSEEQKSESGVSELLAAANAASQALADKLESIPVTVDLADDGTATMPMDIDTREAASKRATTDLDETQTAERLEKWAESVGVDVTLLDNETRSQAFRELSQIAKRMRTF